MLLELFYCQKSKLREAGLARLTFQENMLIGQKKSVRCIVHTCSQCAIQPKCSGFPKGQRKLSVITRCPFSGVPLCISRLKIIGYLPTIKHNRYGLYTGTFHRFSFHFDHIRTCRYLRYRGIRSNQEVDYQLEMNSTTR